MYEALTYGTAIGLALALTGSGGVLAVPALVVGMGMSLPEAVPISLTAVGIAATLGTVEGLYRGLVRYRAAALMALAGAALAPVGIAVGHRLPVLWLTIVFTLLLSFIAIRMLRQAWQPVTQTVKTDHNNCLISDSSGRFSWNRRCFSTLCGIGGMSGFCSGMFGVGGGFIIVPGVRRYSNLAIQGAVATSLMVVALVACMTVIQSLVQGARIGEDGWYFISASCLGMFTGRLFAPVIPGRVLQTGFALLTFLAAGALLLKLLLLD